MSVATQVLMGPQTGAGTSSTFQRNQGEGACTVVAGGLATTETATVQIQDASGNWQTAAHVTGLTATVQSVAVNTPGVYRVSKSATAATVGILVYAA